MKLDEIQKIYDNNYSKVQTEFKDTKTIKYKIVTSQNGTYKDENGIDLEELFNLQDGVYKMNFELKDRSGNSTVYPADKGYYFAVDKTAPQIPTPSITSKYSTTYKLDWSLCTDLNTLEILYSEDGSAVTTTQLEKGVKTHNLTNVVPGKAYDIRFKYTDYAGNEVESVMPKFLTGYKYEGTLNFNGENASHIPNVFFPNDKLSDYGITVKKYYSDGTSIVGSTLVPTPNSYTNNWSISCSCTEGQIQKIASVSGTYYIAKKDSLTQTPVYDSSYHIRDNASDKHYKFGDFPQSVSTISSYSSVPVYNGWYLGSDGYFYEKHTANHRADLKIFANGNEITDGSVYYFKVEPIYWRALSTNYDHDQDSSTAGKTLLFADKVLKGNIPFYGSTATRTINGKTVDSNNWRYSTLRAYLNGSYENGDSQTKTYLDNGFLQKAFTTSARHLITTTKVNNNAASTNIYISSTYYNNGVNVYADSVPTDDKIFLLSLYELTNVNYKFNQAPGNSTAYSVRGRDASDYALCDNVLASPQEGWGCYYWTRSSTHQSGVVRWADTGGNVSRTGAPDCSDINGKGKGIVPALVLNTAP